MDDKNKNISSAQDEEISIDDVADIRGGDSAFIDIPRVKEHPITEDDKNKI